MVVEPLVGVLVGQKAKGVLPVAGEFGFDFRLVKYRVLAQAQQLDFEVFG